MQMSQKFEQKVGQGLQKGLPFLHKGLRLQAVLPSRQNKTLPQKSWVLSLQLSLNQTIRRTKASSDLNILTMACTTMSWHQVCAHNVMNSFSKVTSYCYK